MDDPADRHARPAEVQQQAKLQACGPQVIHTLCLMYIIESPDGFQFYDDGRPHQQVGGIFADDDLS
jgi:hypothetical protein